VRLIEVEEWARRVIASVLAGQRIEDDRVELKSTWIPAKKAARRLAGHANAAHGATLLWLIGLDEKARKVVPVDAEELARWWPSVQAEFEAAPSLTTRMIETPDGTVHALAFETELVPFLVRSADRGVVGAVVEREVPWREGNATRSATRADLLRLLMPTLSLPDVEVLFAAVGAAPATERFGRSESLLRWGVELEVYVVPINSDVVFPTHRAEMRLAFPRTGETIVARGLSFSREWITPGYPRATESVRCSPSEAVITGPGILNVGAEFISNLREFSEGEMLHLTATLHPARADVPVVIDRSFTRNPPPSVSPASASWGHSRPQTRRLSDSSGRSSPPLLDEVEEVE